MISELVCQLSNDIQSRCGDEVTAHKGTLFNIDGLTLCPNHTREYIHQSCSSLSIHKKKFDKLLNRMEFAQ